jgi:hypothetical protein
MSKHAISTFELADGQLIFSVDEKINQERRIYPNHPHNMIDIVSKDADGNDVIPSAGWYKVYASISKDGAYFGIEDGGIIEASKTGGSMMVDGEAMGASFAGNATRIKVVADGIVGAVSAKVTVNQNDA